MAKTFTKAEWKKINDLFKNLDGETAYKQYGLPPRRNKSVLIGSFNIRKLGKPDGKSDKAWDFLARICERFDLLAVQEVMDDLRGIRKLKDKMIGSDFGMIVSDITGSAPGDAGAPERLAFIFKWTRIERTELASDISYDRSNIINTLYTKRKAYNEAWDKYHDDLKKYKEKRAAGKDPAKPQPELPSFLTFIRQPFSVSFKVLAENGADPYEFLMITAHLIYGNYANARRMEFDALIKWLYLRAKSKKKMYYENMMLLGDCNLEFKDNEVIRKDIDEELTELNQTVLKSKRAAKVNFPLLTKHPLFGDIRTNARQNETYDQIALFSRDKRLPTYKDNAQAGTVVDGYDYGAFNFIEFIAKALYKKKASLLSKKELNNIIDKCAHDITDHMPVWIRLPIPGVNI